MKAFHEITLSFGFGSIGQLLQEAIEIATITDRTVIFTFNGVKIWLNSDTKISDGDFILKALREGRKEISISR